MGKGDEKKQTRRMKWKISQYQQKYEMQSFDHLDQRLRELERKIQLQKVAVPGKDLVTRISEIKGTLKEPAVEALLNKVSSALNESHVIDAEDRIELESMAEEVLIMAPLYEQKVLPLLKELYEASQETRMEFIFDGKPILQGPISSKRYYHPNDIKSDIGCLDLKSHYRKWSSVHEEQVKEFRNLQKRLDTLLEVYPLLIHEFSQYCMQRAGSRKLYNKS